MKQLGINDIRKIEDKIIDCIYNDLLKGRLDQKNQQLHVQSTAGRDIKEAEVNAMIAKLVAWDKQLEQAQGFMEKQANSCTNQVQQDFQDQIEVEADYRARMRRAQAAMQKDVDDDHMDDGGDRGGGIGGLMGRFL